MGMYSRTVVQCFVVGFFALGSQIHQTQPRMVFLYKATDLRGVCRVRRHADLRFEPPRKLI